MNKIIRFLGVFAIFLVSFNRLFGQRSYVEVTNRLNYVILVEAVFAVGEEQFLISSVRIEKNSKCDLEVEDGKVPFIFEFRFLDKPGEEANLNFFVTNRFIWDQNTRVRISQSEISKQYKLNINSMPKTFQYTTPKLCETIAKMYPLDKDLKDKVIKCIYENSDSIN